MKLVLFALGWTFFVSFTPGLGSLREFGSWCFEGIAFQKAFIRACLIEVLGFGCRSLDELARRAPWDYGES